MLTVCVVLVAHFCMNHVDTSQNSLHFVTSAHLGMCKAVVAAYCIQSQFLFVTEEPTPRVVMLNCCGC